MWVIWQVSRWKIRLLTYTYEIILSCAKQSKLLTSSYDKKGVSQKSQNNHNERDGEPNKQIWNKVARGPCLKRARFYYITYKFFSIKHCYMFKILIISLLFNFFSNSWFLRPKKMSSIFYSLPTMCLFCDHPPLTPCSHKQWQKK